jgi:hypothetical protein
VKESVPPITFFSNALVSQKQMSDDDMFVCFIVVAMSTFLCPNSFVVASQKFLVFLKILIRFEDMIGVGMFFLGCLSTSSYLINGKVANLLSKPLLMVVFTS